MKNIAKPTLIIAVATALSASSALAATLFDSGGFEGPAYSLGNLAGQNGWNGVFPAANTGVAQVENTVVSSGSQAVQMSGGSSTWNWSDVAYTPAAGEIVRVSFDVRRSAFTAVNNFGYFVDVYDGAGDRIARTGLVRTGTSTAPGSVQGLVTIGANGANAAGSYLIGTPLLNDTWYSFMMNMDFASDTYAVSINGTQISSGLPFFTAASDIFEADLQLSGATGATDMGYFDNYRVEVIPEPTAMSIMLLGLAGLGGRAWLGRRPTR